MTRNEECPSLKNKNIQGLIWCPPACLAKAPRWLIKRMLRWRGDESLEVYARLNNTEWAEWTSKLVDVAVQSTISSRLSYMDFSEETTAHFNEVARSMLSMGTGAPRKATEAL